ncbi:Carbonyl reductase NADPH 1 [Nymphaea thermarum]|nr:Carbonyl reductase NADPH 1 [Nymphaea thermarum]
MPWESIPIKTLSCLKFAFLEVAYLALILELQANFDYGGGTRESYESAKECIDTNYYGTVKLTKALLPFLRLSPHKARIVMYIRDEGLRKQLLETEGLTEQKIDGVLNLFLEDLKAEKAMEKWPLKLPAYSISKASLNAYGRHLALQLNGVAYVNSVHPGAVKTNMTDCTGNLSPIEGAENVVRVALFPVDGPSGHNFMECEDSDFHLPKTGKTAAFIGNLAIVSIFPKSVWKIVSKCKILGTSTVHATRMVRAQIFMKVKRPQAKPLRQGNLICRITLQPTEEAADLVCAPTYQKDVVLFWSQETEGSEWWSGETVAVVTGGNRGIGLEICRQLADKGLTVIMTARKPQEQLSSSAQLFLQEAARKKVIFHALDITQQQSVVDFVNWLKLRVGFVDILVNFTCAGGTSESYESAKECIDTNYYGTKRLTDALLPFLRPSPYKPRIVMYVRDEELRRQLSETEGLTEQKIDGVLNLFLEDLKSEKAMEKWPLKMPAYSISKASLNAYVRLLSHRLKGMVCVNSVHPGIVRTDMTDFIGNLFPTEGAENVLRVALFPVGGPSGHNFLEREDSEF